MATNKTKVACNDIIQYAKNYSVEIVISTKSNKELKRNFNDSLYFGCHIIENTFLSFKRWRDMIT